MDTEAIGPSIGDKRAAEERESGFPARKKRLSDVAKAAEIVLVLAAMGEIRGGAGPTEVEKEMMAEVRVKLVSACEEFAPKDVFPRDAFRAVIRDIGLDQLKEQVGLRPQKLSIVEKFWVTKHKQFQTNSGAAAESHGVLHATITPTIDKPIHPAISTGNFPSLVYQLPASEVKTPHPSGVSTRLLRRDSTPGVPSVDRPDFKPEQRLSGSNNASLAKVPPGNPMLQKSSHYPRQVLLPDNKVPSHPYSEVEGLAVGSTSRVDPQASKPLLARATCGNFATIAQSVRGKNTTQGPSLSNPHMEIGKIVLKVLQPHIPRHTIWNPPSRDYMSKSVPCQVCKLALTEVENALVCDACEKGYHIKCVESHNQQGIPKGEWHCFKCLSLANGKPLPPKYGRVTRSSNTPKVDSNTAADQSSTEKKVEKLGEKENQLKIISKGISGLQGPTVSMNSKHTSLEAEFNYAIGREIHRNDTRCSESSFTPDSAVRSIERAQDASNSTEADSKLLSNGQEWHPDKLGAPHGNQNAVNAIIQKDEHGVVRYEPTKHSGDGGVVCELSSSPVHVSDNVDWIGDVLQVVDEKIYYQSCCVDGVVYKVQDHVFLYSSSSCAKLTPSKLQAMWEDRKTRSKWVIANRCYFHSDLPKAVGCPLSPECNEVYESNHGITVMAGLIRGPCEVLPPAKYSEETHRRSRLGPGDSDGLPSLFLCKWYFDEGKGSFSNVSS